MQLLFRPTKPIWDEYKQGLWMLKVRTTFQIVQSQVPGVLEYELAPGYITDFRSGPSIINPFIPKIGSPNLASTWLIHDVNYHGFLSRSKADSLLLEMLKNAGMETIKRNAVYYAVRLFAGHHYNTLDDDQGPIYNKNKTLVKFRWKSSL